MNRFRYGSTLLVALCGVAACATDPPVRVPDPPVVPAPMPPAPAPGVPLRLTPDVLFVIDSDVDVIVLASPDGLVSVSSEAGPVKVRAKFVEEPGVTRTKTFKGKQVVTVEALAGASGRCEVLVIPVGAKAAGDVIRRAVEVNAAPQPPPAPDPKPKPDPEPVTLFRVIFVYETSAAITPAMQQVMFGEKVRAFLDGKTTPGAGGKGWRRFDKDVDAANEKDADLKALWKDARPQVTAVPCVIVAVNRRADIVPFPADETAAVALFQKYLGGN